MTRRDYCRTCGDMVHDYDVMCDICSDSYCHKCAKSHDNISHFILMNVKILVLFEPNMSMMELNEYITTLKMLLSKLISKFHVGLNANNYYTDFINQCINKMDNIYINNINECKVLNMDVITEIVYDIYTIMCDNDIYYVCSSCVNMT